MNVSSMGEEELGKLAENKTKLAVEAFSQAPGQELESASRTAWGLLNAVTYIIDHRLSTSQDSRLRQAWFGANAKTKKELWKLALAL